jgi:hypothetical protein
MDSDPTFNNLLAHFDRPKTLDLPDFEWVEEVIPFDSAACANRDVASTDRAAEGFIEIPRDTRRGVVWVLAWAGAVATLAVASSVLLEFAYLLAAERTLSVAARAGAMEATLPRATYRSVTAAIDRRLIQYPSLARHLHLSLLQNGSLVQSQFRQCDGDRISISISAPSSCALPDWLRRFTFWQVNSQIQATAERCVPGRKLAYSPRR